MRDGWARRLLQSGLSATMSAVVSMGLVAGCAGTVGGAPVRAPAADNANLALLDTGPYPTRPSHVPGVAGGDRVLQGLLEAHRMADFVLGPWQVDNNLRRRPDLGFAIRTGPIAMPVDINDALGRPFADIVAKHGFIAGFSTMRVAFPEGKSREGASNAVLRFPDHAAASAAAKEMAAGNPTLQGDSPHQPASIYGYPDAIATQYGRADGTRAVESFTPYGPYVLYQWVFNSENLGLNYASGLVPGFLSGQEPLIGQFTPTDPDKLSSLPLDPSGHLLAATLFIDANQVPSLSGGPWQRRGWLHFETDPFQAAAALQAADIDEVAQRSATVYEARNAEAAERFVNYLDAELIHAPSVQPVHDQVPGLPDARCFQRTADVLDPWAPASWRWIQWHFKCVARADRYVYAVFSDNVKDAMQQASAQYRILAGK
jgi:hypothetical protein